LQRASGCSTMADVVFKGKDTDVDWDELLALKQDGTLNKLQQAAQDQNADEYNTLVDVVQKKHYAALCGYRVNKDDAKADVENLSFLFQLTQTLMEIKAYNLQLEEDSTKKLKEKMKKQKDLIKEQQDRIAEQDTEMEEMLNQQQKSLKTPAKGGSESMRSDAEYKSLQKQLDATKEQLNTVQLNFKDEQAKAKELLEKERKATVRPIFEIFIMSKLCLHSSNMS